MAMHIRSLALFSFCLLIIASAEEPAVARQSAAELGLPTIQTAANANVESFELIWKTIRDTHWDEELVGASWDRHRAELLPKLQQTPSIQGARRVMSELINRLDQSHFAVIPSESYEVIDGIPGGSWNVGITARLIKNQILVTQVRKGSPAASQGVAPGWAVISVRGRKASDLINRFQQAAHGPQREETNAGLAMERIMSGNPGDVVPIVFRDGTNQIRQLNLPVQQPPGTTAQLGHLPPMRVAYETKTLPGNIGYFRFNAFLDPLKIMPAYRKAVRDEQHRDGLIIDLRGNVGGIAGMTMGMSGEFVDRSRKLGTMTMRGNKLDFYANPRPKPLDMPVAVLVDECSISSAEIFAGGLQDLGLARIFGSRTAGLALPSVVIRLPNGDGFQYAIADYHSASGQSLEKRGVVPDEPVELTRNGLLQQRDPVLQAAIKWISSKTPNR
jgi:carboxyl-terminal processing protease